MKLKYKPKNASEAKVTGKELENAVEQIERIIFSNNPSLTEADVSIEKRKIINNQGTKHEIDLYIEISLGSGYDSIFIFECKDWKGPVDKNEIIIFSEKIEISGAQKGYFIAKSFSKDAIAQAKKNKRIQLIYIEKEFSINNFPNLQVFYIPHHEISIDYIELNNKFGTEDKVDKLTILNSIVSNNDKIEVFKDYFLPLLRDLESEKIESLQKGNWDIGQYNYSHSKRFDFTGKEVFINNLELIRIDFTSNFTLRVTSGKIISKYDIMTRGRIISFEPIEMMDSTLIVSMIEVYQ